MSNRRPEQELIESFLALASKSPVPDLKVEELINGNCKSRTFADVEYRSTSGLHWIIEAKSHDSLDKYNAVHKIFGELLKETGRARTYEKPRFAVLLPDDGLTFFGKGFLCVDRERFLAFGKLVRVSTVFYVHSGVIQQVSWEQMHGFKSIHAT
jgi:hypothetical protein